MRRFATVVGLRRALELFRQGQRATATEINQDNAGDRSVPAVSHSGQVGLVPTMGALHEGHLSLIRRARQETDWVVVSIFINPLQFSPGEDLDRYPRSLEQDEAICREAGVDVLFTPTVDALYPGLDLASRSMTQVIPPKEMMSRLCGRVRPGHFEGVATVVTKLLSLVQPDRAYFGRKDAQQVAIVERLVQDLNLPVQIVACPIVRESSGLAYSSRNQYLTDEQRSQATVLYRSLRAAEADFQARQFQADALVERVRSVLETQPNLRIDYVELVHLKKLTPLSVVDEAGLLAIAAYLGETRLIDNVVLRNRRPIIAIDGPAGAGKSTVAKRIAESLGLLYLDTGAMYRAVTWKALQAGVDLEDEAAIAELVSQCSITLKPVQSQSSQSGSPSCSVWVNQQEVTTAIRSSEVTAQVSTIAAQSAVRHQLVQQQRQYARQGGVVMDGRDIGTHVFPNAELKIFLTASVQERARRRQQDLEEQGIETVELAQLEEDIQVRDQKDSSRSIAPLRKAPDAIEIVSDRLTIEEVTDKIVSLYRDRLGKLSTEPSTVES